MALLLDAFLPSFFTATSIFPTISSVHSVVCISFSHFYSNLHINCKDSVWLLRLNSIAYTKECLSLIATLFLFLPCTNHCSLLLSLLWLLNNFFMYVCVCVSSLTFLRVRLFASIFLIAINLNTRLFACMLPFKAFTFFTFSVFFFVVCFENS